MFDIVSDQKSISLSGENHHGPLVVVFYKTKDSKVRFMLTEGMLQPFKNVSVILILPSSVF